MKRFLLGIIGCSELIFSINDSEAASFESMKQNVEEGTGLIYNPESDGVMTQE